MKVVKDRVAAVGVRTLSDEDRPKANAWIRRLEGWESDAELRRLTGPSRVEGIHALDTPDDLRIFFALDEGAGTITVVNLLKPSRYATASAAAG